MVEAERRQDVKFHRRRMARTLPTVPVAVWLLCSAGGDADGLVARGVSPEQRPQRTILARHRHQGVNGAECTTPVGPCRALRTDLPLALANALGTVFHQRAALTPQAHSDELLMILLPQQPEKPPSRDFTAASGIEVAAAAALACALVEGQAVPLAREELAEEAAPVGAEAQPAILRRCHELVRRPGAPGSAEPEVVHLALCGEGTVGRAERLAETHLVHDLAPDAGQVLLHQAR
mmetsp:Transcript_19571/g.58970  ORF Transcript_19571/g.58970 Transcript_19571/m.58970 type:complete len:235 (-) Transcript_19571:236-940(-)